MLALNQNIKRSLEAGSLGPQAATRDGFRMVTEENRDMYYSLLEMEALKLRVQKLKNTIGSTESRHGSKKVAAHN